ncbi:MAG: cyclic nucleotide-binding domain-containing protein [Acidobacteriota bacterium]|nr:cyclic nucleotide-binding domain-containing protein [Acidobacteriota bacterium]
MVDLPFFGPKIEHLDRYLARRDYDKALGAIDRELRRDPEDLSLFQRQGDVFELSGDRERAMEVYRELARRYVAEGLHARAVALYKKILDLDPQRSDIHAELAALIDDVGGSERDRSADLRTRELAASTFFTLFEAPILEQVLSSTVLRTYEQGDIVVAEGETGNSLYLLVEGDAKVFTRGGQGQYVPLAELGAGDLFGEVSVLSGKPRTATITASTPITALEVSRDDIERISLEFPQVKAVLQSFCEARAQNAIETLIHRLGRGPRPE